MRSILIIDGDEESRASLRTYLRGQGYKVYSSGGARPGLAKARDKAPDVIISELSLQDMDGMDLIREIKSDQVLAKIPLMILSERTDDMDKVLAFALGADDYIVKPCSFQEITARLKAKLRYVADRNPYSPAKTEAVVKYGDILLQTEEGEVYIQDRPVLFSAKEFKILYILVVNRHKAVDKLYMLEKVLGDCSSGLLPVMDLYVEGIRTKIKENSSFAIDICEVGGKGYEIRTMPAAV